jgi:hypothetical protein
MLDPCPTSVPSASISGAASGRQWKTRMSTRTRPNGRSGSSARAEAGTNRPGDDILNRQVADVLRQGAEARDARDQATSIAEIRANEHISATLRALIEGRRP